MPTSKEARRAPNQSSLIPVVVAAGAVLLAGLMAPDKKAIELPPRLDQQKSGIEDSSDIDRMEAILGEGKVLPGVTVVLNDVFTPEFDERILRIGNPIVTREGYMAYALVDPVTGEVDLTEVSIEGGEFAIGPEPTEGKAGAFEADIRVVNTPDGPVVAIDDAIQRPVGVPIYPSQD